MSHSRRGHLYSFTIWSGNSILSALIALTALSGCGTPTPPTPAPTPTPTPTPNPPLSASNPMPLVPVLNSPDSDAIQIWFLLDNSGSVVGSEKSVKGCKELGRDIRPGFIEYVRAIFTNSVTPQDQQYLLGGIGVFGDKYDTLDWNSPKIPPPDDGNTYYSAGIRGAIDDLYKNKGNVLKRFLVIITDGAFTSETVEDVKTELEEQIRNHRDLSIYVALLCGYDPSLKRDLKQWYSQIDILDNVEVFSSLEDTSKRIFDDLKSQGLIPAGIQSVIVSGPDNIVVPGYFTSAVFSYWSTDPSNSLRVTDYTNDAQETFSPGDVHTFQLTTKKGNGCTNSEFAVSNNGAKGVVFIKPKTFKSLQFFLEPFQNGRLEIVNFAPVSFKLNVFDEQFGIRKWNNCFKVSLVTQDGKPLDVKEQPCNAMGNTNICAELQWNPLQIKDNLSAGIKVKLCTFDGDICWESAVIDVPIMFQASFDSSSSALIKPTGEINGYFNFSNVAAQPHVYLVSNLTEEQYDAAGKMLRNGKACPAITAHINGQLASEITHKGCPPKLSQSNNEILTSMCVNPPPSQYQYQYKYEVATYQYIVNGCGYKHILFTWQDSEDTKAISWMCDILDGDCSKLPSPHIQP